MIDIPCVILAGGKSSRMGEDKSLLPFGKYTTLIEYQYAKFSTLFSNVYISSKNDKFDFLEDKNKIIYDIGNISSPMVALQSIFRKLNFEKVFIITVDTPLVEIITVKEIIYNSDNFDITIANTATKTHNLCGIFTSSIVHKIDEYIDNDMHKINFLIKNSNTNYKEFEFEDQFININTQDDYERAKLI